MRPSMFIVLLMTLTTSACKKTVSTEAPRAETPWGQGAPPPSTLPATTQATSGVAPSPGRAEQVPSNNGPVIIDGTGGGSPGTR